MDELRGSSLPKDIDKESLHKDSISYPENNIKGLIIFEQSNDFILIDKVKNTMEDVINFSMSETESIKNLNLGGRSGAAGGFVNVGSNSHSLSKVTKKENSILIASKNSVGMSCFYDNNDGVTKKFNSVYNDIHMNKLNGKDKFKQLKSMKCYRSITINEMTSRLQSFIITTQMNLNCKKYGNPFENINKIIKGYKSNKIVDCFRSMGYSTFHSIMLAWSCSSGEMRNHIAVHGHTDGNTSHPIETLSLFARIPLLSPITIDTVNIYFKDGYLYFPIDGIVLKYKVGRHVIHCNLRNTLHIPDDTRNNKNWSKVTGP